MLFIWVGLGGIFFLNRRNELLHIPHSRLRYLLFGRSSCPVLFEPEEEEEEDGTKERAANATGR